MNLRERGAKSKHKVSIKPLIVKQILNLLGPEVTIVLSK